MTKNVFMKVAGGVVALALVVALGASFMSGSHDVAWMFGVHEAQANVLEHKNDDDVQMQGGKNVHIEKHGMSGMTHDGDHNGSTHSDNKNGHTETVFKSNPF